VWANKVFVTQTLSDSQRRTLMCFDRANGKLLWQSGPAYSDSESTQRDNPYCSATPVTDGERIIASFGSAGLYCYDFTGKELWHRDVGKMEHMFGNAASPILVGDLCIWNFGPDKNSRLIAINTVSELTNASLAVSNGEIFLRTDKALWCIGPARN
jgi:outer membrane protein assembly factor BamB